MDRKKAMQEILDTGEIGDELSQILLNYADDKLNEKQLTQCIENLIESKIVSMSQKTDSNSGEYYRDDHRSDAV